MDKRSFKIGDKVKLTNPSQWKWEGMGLGTTGKIVAFDTFIRVDWGKTALGSCYPHIAREIEHAAAIGEQLLFSFMEGG